MGALTSRQNIGVEEVDIPSNSVYRYPPKSGKSPNNRSERERGGGVYQLHVSKLTADVSFMGPRHHHQNHQYIASSWQACRGFEPLTRGELPVEREDDHVGFFSRASFSTDVPLLNVNL